VHQVAARKRFSILLANWMAPLSTGCLLELRGGHLPIMKRDTQVDHSLDNEIPSLFNTFLPMLQYSRHAYIKVSTTVHIVQKC